MSYLLIVLLVGSLILIHELGHFVAARWVGIPVRRFSIGFGPRIWGFSRGGTDFCVSAIPLGGYVLPDVEDEEAHFRIPACKRFALALGGPLANLLLPVPLLAVGNLLVGHFSLYAVLVAPWLQTREMAIGLVASLPQLFQRPDEVSGVLGIVAQGGQFVGGDPIRAIRFAVLLSLNLAVLNLLPIPVLDGGKMAMLLMEKVFPRSVRLYMPLALLGLVFILGLFAYTTILDVRRLVM